MVILRSALAAAVTAAVVVAPLPAQAAPATPQWKPCAGTDIGTECATLTLPVDWDHPDGPTFGFAIARHRADPAAREGTLVFGPGGPGDSGVSRLTTAKNIDRFSPELLRRFDIVSFDPRGVGGSQVMPCPTGVSPVVTSQAEFTALRDANRAAWADCRDTYGELWDHADTAGTVRDLDALRAALGESRLTFHGSSYGTLLGEQYAERYPGRVRAMVLESAVDHIHDAQGFLSTQTWALQDSFDAFATWCAGAEVCALHGRDVHAVWAGLNARADRGELQGWSVWDLTINAHVRLYGPTYEDLATTIDNLDRGLAADKRGAPPMVTPVMCADWALPVRDFAEYDRMLRASRTRDFRYSGGVFAISSCLGWDLPVANPQHRLDVHTRTPILQLGARHDPAVGWNWTRSVARQLGRSGVLLAYAGAGHGTYKRACVAAAVDAYLLDLTLPPRGTVCPAE
ncbi:alpha/beta hydrolase [Symbioplanes lichenis]|uniref:alpha/beta hydrolase n=1 Tax=Symbioplanes lichenis TaxID=1629072 RepID=UPI00273857BC|nr:alpha/beta hydrolase [Actinoplanes lichenis]